MNPLASAKNPPKFRRALIEAEKQIKRANQQCLNCEEKWVKGHKCKGRLFLLAVDGSYITEYMENNIEEERFENSYESLNLEVNQIILLALKS